jgi:EmrB/QacA subfamily drug resistance transporter
LKGIKFERITHTRMQASSQPTGKLKTSAYKWKVLATVIVGFFMILLDTTVINVAFPALRQEFGGSLNESQWIISVYVLAMGISMPISGFLADRFGSKKIYLGGLGLFIFGSILCGMSNSLYMLIAFRILQGLGGGIAMPLGTALLLQAFPPEEQGMALGIQGIAALVAPALGPVLGGWLVTLNLWRVIFFINPPIGLIGIWMGFQFLREQKNPGHKSIDFLGIITEIIGFGAILYAATIAADVGWTATSTLTWFGIGAAGLAAFTIIEMYVAKDPLLDLRLFSKPVFLKANLLSYISTLALFGAEFLLPIYLQSLRGKSPLETGIILLPMAITAGILGIVSGRIYDRIGPRPILVLGFGMLAVNTWQLAQLQAQTSINWILILLTIRGIALGLIAQTTMVTALSDVPPRELPRGSSLNNATRQVTQSIGVAILATVLAGTVSLEVRTVQDQINDVNGAHYAGICETTPISVDAPTASISSAPTDGYSTDQWLALRQRDCRENVKGFENSYLITFYASLVALVIAFTLPGWPKKWSGRKSAETPVIGD